MSNIRVERGAALGGKLEEAALPNIFFDQEIKACPDSITPSKFVTLWLNGTAFSAHRKDITEWAEALLELAKQ